MTSKLHCQTMSSELRILRYSAPALLNDNSTVSKILKLSHELLL